MAAVRYWDAEIEGERIVLQCDAAEAALAWAQDDFEETCFNNEIRGDSSDIKLLHIEQDDDGEETILEIREETIEYEYERSDYEEHGTYWNAL